jgi:hypothetical protein
VTRNRASQTDEMAHKTSVHKCSQHNAIEDPLFMLCTKPIFDCERGECQFVETRVEAVLGWDSNLLWQRFFVWSRDTSVKGGLRDVSRKHQDDKRTFRHAISDLLFDINLDWRTQNAEKKHYRARFAQWINIRCTVRQPSQEGGCRLCRDPACDTKSKKNIRLDSH